MAKNRGFTLLELIATIAILGVLSVGIFGFIKSSTDGYIDYRVRDQLQSQARFSVERIGRELRHAVPYSVEINKAGNCLSYVPIVYPGMFNKFEDNTNTLEVAMSTDDLDWSRKIEGHRIVFGPSKSSDLEPSITTTIDPTNPPRSYAIQKGIQKNKNLGQLILDKAPKTPWPAVEYARRFYIYKETVNFCFQKFDQKDVLLRSVGPISENNTKGVVLAENVSPLSRFVLADSSLSHNELIYAYYKFEQSGEISVYNQQIQVLNVP